MSSPSTPDPSHPTSSSAQRSHGTTVAHGHAVLGAPIGTDAFVESFVASYESRALSLLTTLRRLLLGSRRAAWDEFDLLVRFCLHPRLRHFTRTLPPGAISYRLQRFQDSVLDAHLASVPDSCLNGDVDARRLAELPGRLGGHGLLPIGTDRDAVSYHDAGWYGSWAAVWHYARAWLPPLRGRQLARVGRGGGFPYQRSVALAWSRLSAAHTAATARGTALLPSSAPLPDLYSALTDGRASPVTAPLGAGGDDLDGSAPSPLLLTDLDYFDETCHPHAQRAASAVVSSLAFLSLYDASSPRGRARLLDGSVARGPFSFWRRVPVAHLLPDATAPLFAFQPSAAFATALALDLLAFPPSAPEEDAPLVCTACRPTAPDATLATLGARHHVQCPHGMFLDSTCHRPVVAALAECFAAVLGRANVLADLGPSHDAALIDWMQGPGAGLQHSPDLVLTGLDGPGTYRIVEVKTIDVTGPTHIQRHHTDTTRLGAHLAAETRSRRHEYRLTGDEATELPRGIRISFFVTSTSGSLHGPSHSLLRDVARRSGRHLPASLLPVATWAAPAFAPFVCADGDRPRRTPRPSRVRPLVLAPSRRRARRRPRPPSVRDPRRAPPDLLCTACSPWPAPPPSCPRAPPGPPSRLPSSPLPLEGVVGW